MKPTRILNTPYMYDKSTVIRVSTNSPIDSVFQFYEKLGVNVYANPSFNPKIV